MTYRIIHRLVPELSPDLRVLVPYRLIDWAGGGYTREERISLYSKHRGYL